VELCAHGWRSAAIAEELGVSARTVRDWRAQPGFDDEVQAIHHEIRKAAKDHLRSLAAKATARLESLLDRHDEAPTQRGAALDILKMIGLEPPDEVHVKDTTDRPDLRNFTDAELATYKALVKKAKGGDGRH
jgi:transposase